MTNILTAGTTAPDFTLAVTADQKPSLRDLRGRRGEFRGRVQRDFSDGVRSGVNGTPTFFINGQRHDADFELQTLAAAIRHALPPERPEKSA